jgi:hypothetical protein
MIFSFLNVSGYFIAGENGLSTAPWNVCWWRVLPLYSHVKEIEARALRSEGNRPCLMVAGKLVFWSGRQGKNTNALPAPSHDIETV